MSRSGPSGALVLVVLAALALTGCGAGAAGEDSGAGPVGPPVDGGTLRAGMTDNPDHLDSGLAYSNEGWEMLEATGDGLLTYKRVSGPGSSELVPDLATAMPKVTDGGRTYTFHVRSGIRFAPPVDREVRPSDLKFSIERLFRVDSGGVGFYGGIVGADAYAKAKKGGISGIVADDAAHTIVFRLTKADGTFPAYMAIPFAYAVPAGTPDHDISTESKWRVGTGPYVISSYRPKDQIVLTRNPNFRQWTRNTPNGHLDRIQISIGVDPEGAVNQIANGDLDWYMEQVPPDRLAELRARWPHRVHGFQRNNIEYFALNMRKAPFDKLAVRQAVNYAIDRTAIGKLFGGEGPPSENIIPPGFAGAYVRHDFYPHDVAKAKALIAKAGVKGMHVNVLARTLDPYPQAAQYFASVLDEIGFTTSVHVLDESVYTDTISSQKGDPQASVGEWNQDFPEGQDFIDVLLNGEHISDIGNNNTPNADVKPLNAEIDRVKAMPLGPARQKAWARLDATYTRDVAPFVVYMNLGLPKFVSARLHGLVFNPTYFELLPSMWVSK